jgi:hypothetical protein
VITTADQITAAKRLTRSKSVRHLRRSHHREAISR